MKLDKLNGQNMRVVEVVANRPDIAFTNTAYDEGEDLYKVEDVWFGSNIWRSFYIHARDSRPSGKWCFPRK